MKRPLTTGIALFILLSHAAAQLDINDLTRKFNEYQSTWKETRVQLILNQEKYSPGDTAWFKVYFLAADLSPIPGKQKIYVNLTDSHGDAKVHATVNVYDGVGASQILLPEDLSAGIYLVTAYSNWMKNFDPIPLFRKEIAITAKNSVSVKEERPRLSVFIEGGHVIRDVPNRVCFRGGPPGSTVQLTDTETGALMGQAAIDSNGLATLVFTPARHGRYEGHVGGAPGVVCSLPPTEEDGCAILLVPSMAEGVKILMAMPRDSKLRGKQLTFVVSCKGKICHAETFIPGGDAYSNVLVKSSVLPGGVAHVSLLDDTGELLAIRDFFSPGPAAAVARISTPKRTFRPREEVAVEVSLTDPDGQAVQGEFSIAAVNDALFTGQKRNSLGDELCIRSTSGDFAIDRSDPNWLAAVDTYFICETQALPWKNILSAQPMKPAFGFTNAIARKGKVVFGDTGGPVPDHTRILFYLQKDGMHYETFTLGAGNVRVTLPDVFGSDEFFYIAETRKGKELPDIKIRWEEDTIALPAARTSSETATADPYASFISKTRQIDRSYNFYTGRTDNGIGTTTDVPTLEEEIGGADIDVNVREYVAMSSMAELLREVVPSLYARQSGNEGRVRVNLPEPLFPVRGDPVYIIDGIATKNTAFFLSLNPAEVLRIKVVTDPKKLMPYKLMGRNGIVIVETKMGNAREPLDDPAKLIAGVNKPLPFRGPDFSHDPARRIPDFRATLYWNPSVKTDTSGKAFVHFSCSDDLGTMRIRVDGIAAGGRPFSTSLTIEVHDK